MKYQSRLDRLPSLKGKVAIVTGANSGIGFFTALHLAYLGARVIMACRNKERASNAMKRIKEEVPEADLLFLSYDQSDFSSIDGFVEEVHRSVPHLDFLICNAGVYFQKKDLSTKQGIELTVGTNYYGTHRLLSKIEGKCKEDRTRIVIVTSLTAPFAKKRLTLSDVGKMKRNQSYAFSKRCLSRLGVELSSSLDIALAHPGIASTNIISSQDTGFSHAFQVEGHRFLTLFTHSSRKASFTSVMACFATDEKRFVRPRGPFAISGFPRMNKFPKYAKKPILKETKESLEAKGIS